MEIKFNLGDKVRLSVKVLTSNVPFPERCYSQYMEVTEIKENGFLTVVPAHLTDEDRRPHDIYHENLELVERAFSWGSPVSGNHDPADYADYYEDVNETEE